jgi:hypothetical protein
MEAIIIKDFDEIDHWFQGHWWNGVYWEIVVPEADEWMF